MMDASQGTVAASQPQRACLYGYSSPTAVAFVDGKLFAAVGGSIVVQDDRGECSLWQPVEGSYDIHHIAASSRGLLCISERRLDVALLLYNASSLHMTQEIAHVATVEVHSLCFSDDGATLFALSTMPACTMQLFGRAATGDRLFELTRTIQLPCLSFTGIYSIHLTQAPTDFAILADDCIYCYSAMDAETHREMICLTVDGATVTAAAATADGMLVGLNDGRLLLYSFAAELHSYRSFGTLGGGEAASALCAVENTYYAGTSQGSVYRITDDGTDATSMMALLVTARDAVRSLAIATKAAGRRDVLYICTDGALYAWLREEDGGTLHELRRRVASPLVRCLAADANTALLVYRNGSLARCADGEVLVMTQAEAMTVIDACCVQPHFVVIVCDDGVVRYYDTTQQRLLCTQHHADFRARRAVSNGQEKLVLCDEHCLYFFCATPDALRSQGHLCSDMTSAVTTIRWLDDGSDCLLAACDNGEVFLLDFPQPCAGDVEHAVEALVLCMWRLDYPVTDMLPCYADADVINLFVHSVDKDAKLYALERRREPETKVIRPLFLMHDHEGGGTCLARLNEHIIVSAGRDGRVTVRDVACYQARLTPIPPSKEKRKTLHERRLRSFANGAITSLAVVGDMVVAGGRDPVVRVVSATLAAPPVWQEPHWTHGELRIQTPEPPPRPMSGNELGEMRVRETLLQTMARLRGEWATAMAQNDMDVPVDALLIVDQQAAFNEECEVAVDDMREAEHYHALENEFIQDTIRRRCCDTMEVVRAKIVSVSGAGNEVHNFHMLGEARAAQAMARKIGFLRRLQLQAAQGYKFAGLRAVPDATSPSADATLTAPKLTEPGDTEVLYDALDVYTRTRATMQAILLRSVVTALKDNFNMRFSDLRERKRHMLAEMEERTRRCTKIVRQLDETPGELFVPYVDRQEDPTSLFTVLDDELPDEVRALIVRQDDGAVLSPANEAALKQWMDGLEKDVEVLQVRVDLPDFADDTRDDYVPPDERTEEQTKAMELYEKRLKDETELIAARKDALRNEFALMQKQNQQAADKLDDEIHALQRTRLSVTRQVNNAEFEVAKLTQHLLAASITRRRLGQIGSDKAQLSQRLCYTTARAARRRVAVDDALATLDKMRSRYATFANDARGEAPFTDTAYGDKLHRRFNRWKQRFDDGKAVLPQEGSTDGEYTQELWTAFCRQCETVAALRREVNGEEERCATYSEEYEMVQKACTTLKTQLAELEQEEETLRSSFVRQLLNTDVLYHVHQGQIQHEGATVSSDFAAMAIRWSSDVRQYNDLILSSYEESTRLLEKISQRHKRTKLVQWESERLNYEIGTLEMELRQLHTIRVTQQMQACLHGNHDTSEAKELQKVERHMALVEANMQRKLKKVQTAARRLQGQIAERASENMVVHTQCEQLRSRVEDVATVKGMVDMHTSDAAQGARRARQIFQTSELEELARAQQEELIRLKAEVDRLRERTFPSFAVVAKRTV